MNKNSNAKYQGDFLIVAVIIGAHGIRGEVKLKPLSEEGTVADLERAYLLSPDEQSARPVRLSAKTMKNGYIATLDGSNDRDEAESLKGYYIAMAREEAPQLPEGRFYTSDLVGCTVTDVERGQIGVFDDSISSPGADIFVIKRKGKKDLLVPILEDSLINVDLDKRLIEMKLPEGLWEIYE